MKEKRIIFMGTPEFAATILEHLVKNQISIAAVVTVPDKPAGRGQKLAESAVKKCALLYNLPVLQPVKLKDPEFLERLAQYNADLFVVIAFRMLPEAVYGMPPLGTINLHGSLLPQYRGAAPINRAVINGEQETGVTTFFIEKEIDTGEIIQRKSMPIGPNETAGEVHDRMMHLGAEVTLETVQAIFENTAKGTPQSAYVEVELKDAPKIFKQDCKINWNQTAEAVHNFIRGLSPYPTAWTSWPENGNKTLKIFKTVLAETGTSETPGKVQVIEGRLFIACATGALEILELQMEGKKRVPAKDFINGLQASELFWE